MKQHKTWAGKVLASIGHFFSGGLKAAATAAVSITEEIKTVLSSGFVKTVAGYVDEQFKTHLAEDVIAGINSAIPKVLAVELAVEGLPDNPTEQDVLDFENRVYKAVTGLDPVGTSKLYSTLGAQIYGIIKPQVDSGEPLTWAIMIKDVEDAYQDYLKDLQDSQQP